MTEEEKKAQLEKDKQEALENVKKTAEEAAKGVAEKSVKELNDKVAELTAQLEKATKSEDIEAVKKELTDSIDKLSAEVKKQGQITDKTEKNMSIHDAISGAIIDNAETIKSFRGGEKTFTIKEVTDANWASGALGRQTTDVRRDLYNSPYSPLYLRNIFPNITTDSASIVIPQLGTVTGGVDEWARGTGTEGADVPKPDVTPNYKDITVTPKWIAGITTVNRELLLNVRYLQGSIANTLLYSRYGIFARENKLITDYLSANAVNYSGSKTIAVEKLVDAAFGQLLGNYMNPTHVLMNPSDYLEHIKLNKATGSGEYDLPNNTLSGFNANGIETTVQVVPIPTLTAGTAYVVSAPEFEFINRLSPELRMFEQNSDNVLYNKVTFRVEEMVAFVAKDLNAMVKVTL